MRYLSRMTDSSQKRTIERMIDAVVGAIVVIVQLALILFVSAIIAIAILFPVGEFGLRENFLD